MSENRCSCSSGGGSSGARETVCIDTYRVLDSCRDRDCYENVRCFLDAVGQDLVNTTTSGIRVKEARILWTNIGVDPILFNRGFYQIDARFYVLIRAEACTGMGRAQDFYALAVLDKKVVLYGGEGNASIFRGDGSGSRCGPFPGADRSSNSPIAVVETVEPVVLGSCVIEPREESSCPCYCCCTRDDVPPELTDGSVTELGELVDPEDGHRLYVSLGLFSVFRVERPAQFLVSASDYSVPDKECQPSEPSSPCSLFRQMAFPTGEFSATGETDGKRC